MILFLLLRRLSPRTRIIAGSAVIAAGLVLAAVAAAMATGLVVHGVALAAIGAVMVTSGIVSQRRTQPAGVLSAAGHRNGR